MNIKELRSKTKKELADLLKKKELELVNKKFEIKLGKEKNTAILKQMRKAISRIKTVIREKEVINEQ